MNILKTLRSIVQDQVDSTFDVNQLKYSAKAQFSSVDKRVYDDETPVSLCNYVDVYYNDTITEQIEFMRGSATANEIDRFRLQEGDVIITKDSESWDDIAIPAFVSFTSDDVLCGYHLAQIRPNISRLNGKYLFYLLSSSLVNYQFRVASTGVTRYGLGKYWLDNAIVPIPDVNVQAPIAAFLDIKTTQIDALIAKKQRQIELLKEKRSSLITRVVTKGLNPDVKMKDSGVEWLGEMPEHWELIRVKRAGAIRYGLGQPPNELDEGLPLIRATDLHAGVIDTQSMLYVDPDDIPWSKNPLLHAGEIIVVRSGAYTGDSAIIPEALEGSIAGYDMVVTPTTLDPLLLSYYFLSDFFMLWQLKPETLRAAQPHLNAEELGSFLILRPPLDEQLKIGQWLEEKLFKIKNLTEQISKSIELLVELRSSLISEAVTGKLPIGETK